MIWGGKDSESSENFPTVLLFLAQKTNFQCASGGMDPIIRSNGSNHKVESAHTLRRSGLYVVTYRGDTLGRTRLSEVTCFRMLGPNALPAAGHLSFSLLSLLSFLEKQQVAMKLPRAVSPSFMRNVFISQGLDKGFQMLYLWGF